MCCNETKHNENDRDEMKLCMGNETVSNENKAYKLKLTLLSSRVKRSNLSFKSSQYVSLCRESCLGLYLSLKGRWHRTA